MNFLNHKLDECEAFRVKSIRCVLQGDKDPFPVQRDSDGEPNEHGGGVHGQQLSVRGAVQRPVQREVLLQELAADVQEQRVLT
ncbi:unnamed protein product [Arctia plantaginis]|uniref:Uncharacterized protein n=1 Tax=Arctia plantaginis TaxID=874455 RepID=A0A8S0ZAF5_ARCPL|nr:unnamed protein product [Arctia plantaginis]